MTKKRAANRELNHDNWDQEDSDEEERGSIAVASEDILQKRTILKAKRRKPTDSPEPEAVKPVNIFQGFSFTSSTSSASSSNSTTALPTFSFFPTSSVAAAATSTKSASEASKTTPSSSSSGLSNVVTFATEADSDAKSESSYQKEIERLNKSFLDWITHHINKNPCCILSPVFKDYNRYISELDMECACPSNQQPGNKTDSLPTNPTLTFSSNPPFSFGSSSSSTFGKGFFSKPAEQNTETSAGNEEEKEEEYVPPKPESVETKEEGSFYTIRCKLYYKKEEKYDERGVGFLHLKPNGSKTQMIVRTDTALGNILLNINVGKLMPISRQGVNNVNLICIPNPPLDEKRPSNTPIPILIRVKTKDNADELFKHLTEAQAKL
ncbi:hypothetical protein HELRODRAFT_155617 [Helobdella robusta]|uniref:RanBD1 domain-containing protein n=1 Tax=Helobdella robusta TaxID=6412 RepID=T1ELJ8_HELRO|nr:hypothetical protein HELRODRAFT_155617 [Helobdella robusta]ESO12977.1 hypothetical protein HELRODRAFT_155617 [Helobdella robusta]